MSRGSDDDITAKIAEVTRSVNRMSVGKGGSTGSPARPQATKPVQIYSSSPKEEDMQEPKLHKVRLIFAGY
jgi:hypothetical protein